jgi:hypothetical protein
MTERKVPKSIPIYNISSAIALNYPCHCELPYEEYLAYGRR